MELVKENVTVNQVSCKGDTQVLVDEDIIVPDVKPDILKILQLDAVSCITNKEITNGRVNVTGNAELVKTKDVVEGQAVVATAQYTPSKNTKNGTWIAFGIEA